MNLFINREGPVPIHDQLCAQLAQHVAAGSLPPGAKLPSIRALAQRTKLHHNTILAAYQELARRGLLVIKEGSGARVADLASGAFGQAAIGLARAFVQQARAAGFADAEVRLAFERALAPTPIERLVVVNPHPDLQDLYMHELATHFDFPIGAMTLEEVAAQPMAAREAACFLTSTNHAPTLAPLLADTRPPVLFVLAGAGELLAIAQALPPDAVVAVVSGSPRYLFLTHQMLAGAREEATLMAAPLDDAGLLATALKRAALVVTDARVHDQVARQTAARVYRAPLLADAFFATLEPLLPPGAVRRPSAP